MEARYDFVSDACCEELAFGKMRGPFRAYVSTVVGFFVDFIDAFSMVEFVVIFLGGVADHADLIMFVDEVAFK